MNFSIKQEYCSKPLSKNEVKGESSKTIFKFMTESLVESMKFYYPRDVDDFERNRALLLQYHEWKERLIEMAIYSPKWKILVENWSTIEKLYDRDYEKYGHKAYGVGECDQYIRSLIK